MRFIVSTSRERNTPLPYIRGQRVDYTAHAHSDGAPEGWQESARTSIPQAAVSVNGPQPRVEPDFERIATDLRAAAAERPELRWGGGHFETATPLGRLLVFSMSCEQLSEMLFYDSEMVYEIRITDGVKCANSALLPDQVAGPHLAHLLSMAYENARTTFARSE